ncbi:hypothetical protein F2Q69_00060465 [Brassica cretica]|uniref:Uncharacterized protein n=1 Tax=Brassica cretica TaxID=69181 RepID=A0A8S9RSD2_BRACR|nr:hypothetical protein F2Q69_00060465 [Brassica cretica]
MGRRERWSDSSTRRAVEESERDVESSRRPRETRSRQGDRERRGVVEESERETRSHRGERERERETMIPPIQSRSPPTETTSLTRETPNPSSDR